MKTNLQGFFPVFVFVYRFLLFTCGIKAGAQEIPVQSGPLIAGRPEIPSTVMFESIPENQLISECSFFGGDSLSGFNFATASKKAKADNAVMYGEFRSFVFREQVKFVKDKYHIAQLPFEIKQEANNTQSPNMVVGPCSNLDFEDSDLNSWTGSQGYNEDSGSPFTIQTSGTSYTRNSPYDNCSYYALISPLINPAYPNDHYGGFPGVSPNGGNYSVRLGSEQENLGYNFGKNCNGPGPKVDQFSAAEELEQTFVVSAANALITYQYAVILNDGGHKWGEQPYFEAIVTKAGDTAALSQCTKYYQQIEKGITPPGFILSTHTSPTDDKPSNVYYRPWTYNSVNLTPYIGQTVTLKFIASGCALGAHFGYAYIDATCGPAQIMVSNSMPCVGKSVTLNAPPVAGGTYSWTGPGIVGSSTNQSAIVNANGTYSVTVIPGQGASCKYTLSVPVVFFNISLATASSNINCYGGNSGSASVNPSGGNPAYSYFWSSGQTTSAVTGLTMGTYTVQVTDAGGCTKISTVSITQPNALTTTVSNILPATCGNNSGSATASASGGTAGGYLYLWMPGGCTSAHATGLAAGIYTVTVTDPNGCTDTKTANIINANGPVLTTTVNADVACFGENNGSATANPQAGTPAYTFMWSNGQTTQTATGLAAGNYMVTVKDSNGCAVVSSVSIMQPGLLTSSASQTPVLCNGGTATASVNPSGGTPGYLYNWSNGQTSSSISWINAGTYSVVITDAHSCPLIKNFVLTEPAALAVSFSSSDVKCAGDNSGTASITSASGGTGAYTYAWGTNPVQTTQVATGFIAGTYSVVVKDANGCSILKSFAITQPAKALSVNTVNSGSSCGTNANGVITSYASNGTGPYTYLWNNGNTTQIISNILAGTYTLTVTDANGCREINISTLPENIKPYADFSSVPAISCEGVHLAFKDASTDAITWDWAFGNSGSSTMQNPEFVFPYNGTYNVTLIVTNPPCADTVSKPVVFSDISDYFSIAQTNVFTPNSDGTNDCFRPGFAGIGADSANLNDCIEFEVFDRWGVKMFKSAEADNCWHGNNLKNSTPAVEGTYFYIAKLGKITSKGYITLLRNR